jgi:hypothetical protein
MTPSDPEPAPKPRRRRTTRAAREEARATQAAADAAKPIDPAIWVLLGGLILFVAFWIWVDPETFVNAGHQPSVFQIIPAFMVGIFGRTPAALILTVLGGIPLAWGVYGWLRRRFGKQRGA